MRPGKSISNRILRAKFSSITPHDIKSAMNKLVAPNQLDAKAVDVRQELDLKVLFNRISILDWLCFYSFSD